MNYLLIAVAFGLLFSNSLCMAMERIDKAMVERANRQMDEGTKREESWKTNVTDRLYVGMPEEEFKQGFNSQISNEEGETIYFYEPESGLKSRATFENERLIRIERFGRQYGIPGTGNYYDVTSSLQGYENKNGPGFYSSMAEGEFLSEFSGSIISHSGNEYIVHGKNGRKYRVNFTDGYLSGMESFR